MKISIPVLDMYIEKCKSTGVKPIFESFTVEANDEAISNIDSKLFEAYQAYSEGSRIISILEYQAIKSYSEFLENEDELANMPEEGEEEEEDKMAQVNQAEIESDDDDDDDDDDDEVEESAKEIKKAEHGPEKKAKIEELPATDDEFGIEIDIETIGKDIDASFKEIEDAIMKLGEPEKENVKDGAELVGEESQESERQLTEEELLEAAEENNIIMDFLFRRPKINKIMKKATTLRIQGVQAETKAGEMIAKKNEEMEEKIAQLKQKNATPDQIKKFKEKYKESIDKFEDTLDKKMDAATEAADEIEKEADNIATSNYLKKILSKAKIDARMEEAQAKMKTADETKQQELKDNMKEMQADAAETEKELDAQDGEAKKKVKELGLSDDEFETLDKIKTDLDNLSDKEKVLSNKMTGATDDKEKAKIQKSIDGLDAEKFKIWEGLPKILDKIKDKNKKASMYKGATGVGEISNSAELKDYIDTKTAEAKKREDGDTVTNPPAANNPGTSDPATKDPATKDPATKDPGTSDPATKDPATKDPGTSDPATKDPATKDPATKDPATKDPATKDPATKDPATKDPATKDPGTSDPATKDPATKDPATKDPATKDPGTSDPATKDPATKDPGTSDPATKDPGTSDPATKDPATKDPATKDPATKDPAQKKKEIEQKLSTASSKLENAKKSLEAKKADPSAKPEAISAIEKNIASLETEVKNLEAEKAKIGESNMVTFEMAVNYLSAKIDEVVNSINNISTYPVNESKKYESVASRFRQALKGK